MREGASIVNRQERRRFLLGALGGAGGPRTGAQLAALCGVSRQIIVKDIAALRKGGAPIIPTPAGYALTAAPARRVVTCRHDEQALLEKELQTVVEGGGTIVDVFVEHPRYGVMRNELRIATPRDIAKFLRDMRDGLPLCTLTDGVHMHTLEAPDGAALDAIAHKLRALGILLAENS